MKKSAQRTNLDLLEGIFTKEETVYSRSFYFFGTFALLLVFFSFLTFFLYFLNEPTQPPEDVLITDVTPTSVTITWKTEKETRGLVIYTPATTPKLLRPIALLSLPINNRVFEKPYAPTKYHKVTLEGLYPNTAYLYRISTGLHTYKIDTGGKLLPAIKTIH